MNDAQMDALKYTLTASLLSALGGGGLAYLANKRRETVPEEIEDLNTTAPEFVEIPYPVVKKKNPNELLPHKTASFMSGQYANHWSQVPWFPLAAVGGTSVAGLGAYKLIDEIMKSKRKKTMEEELTDAEEEYREALLNSYNPKRLQITKTSKAQEINEGLEKLASMLKVVEEPETKTASKLTQWLRGDPRNFFDEQMAGIVRKQDPNIFSRLASGTYATTSEAAKALAKTVTPNVENSSGIAGIPTGLALLAAGSIPIMSGLAAYNYFKKRNKTKLVNDAAEMRALQRLSENIPAPYAAIEE